MNTRQRSKVSGVSGTTSPFFGTTTGPQKSSLNGIPLGKMRGSAWPRAQRGGPLNFMFRGSGTLAPFTWTTRFTTWTVSPLKAIARLR